MRGNKYLEELKKEREVLKSLNPFSKSKPKNIQRQDPLKDRLPDNPLSQTSSFGSKSGYYYPEKNKSSNYFNLILTSDYRELELDIRGLRYVQIETEDGKKEVILQKREGHYLSDDGAEDLLFELKGHLSPDIKLGVLTQEEFLKTQDIIRKAMLKYIRNNLYKLGMDTEAKQRKASTLAVIILNRIRAVYSRSIKGIENQRSHGDINLSGGLDMDRESRFNLEDMKN